MLLFYATTDVLLLNMYHLKVTSFPDDEADLFIENNGRMSNKLIGAICSSNVFNNVIILSNAKTEQNKENNKQNLLSRYFNTISYFKYRYKSEKKQYQTLIKHIIQSPYTIVFVPGFHVNSLYYIWYSYKYNNNVDIRFVEHGATSFYLKYDTMCNPLLDISNSRLYVNIYKILWLIRTGKNILKISKICKEQVSGYYLYNPQSTEQLSDENNTQLIPYIIPKITNTTSVLMKETILDIDIYEYNKRAVHYIAFEEAKTEHIQHNRFLEQIQLIAEQVGSENLIIKAHPGMKIKTVSEISPNIYIDNRKYLLEALYSSINTNDKIIIAHSSGVLFHLKYMYNNEPHIIFTYRLYPRESIGLFNEKMLNIMTDDLIAAYSDKSRIHVPKSLEELEQILINISHNQSHHLS